MEPLKNTYNQQFIKEFSIAIKQAVPDFNSTLFINSIFTEDWNGKELKQRMRHITLVLKEQLATDFEVMIKQVLKIIEQLQVNNVKEQGFEWMFLPEFVELYGLDNYKTSVKAFEIITQFVSCEFAVRPFIIKYPKQFMEQMLAWTRHKSEHVRRLASEGCRPMLPWSMALPMYKKNPNPILPVLKNLKNDTSEYVRRSVANNLNDIAKNQPEIVIKIAKNWFGKTTETDKLVKHACRTLLKAGNLEIMPLFGFDAVENIKINVFKINNPNIKIGDYLDFNFQLATGENKQKLRLEYAIYYQKANKTLAKKVFKISEKTYPKNTISLMTKKQSFKIISTRKFHLGLHQISVIINGVEFNKHDFYLI